MSKKKAAQVVEAQVVEAQVVEAQVVEAQVVEAQVVEAQVVEAQVVEATVDQIMNAMVTTKTFKTVKTVKTGVGKQILQLISDGVLSNKEIVAKVLVDNPLRKTTYACVAWYKSQVSAGKIDLPKPREEVMMTEEELADFGDE